ncbi:hypothetical protein [Neptunomonas sp. XY-337]|uniref:hypothetical protein n=1 Tax=Neptunomonas sp. XY-337 TaxID=2561897 RepID=UPI0010AAECDD|nr:hypothetical protein [Neptunomonas sp. XY-337]
MTNLCRRNGDRSDFPRPGFLIALLVIAMCGLAGCASNEPISANQLELIKSQMAQSTLRAHCPSGCDITYKDPRDKLHVPRQTNGWDFANNVVNKSVGIAPWAAVTKIAADGFKAAGHNTSNSYNSDSVDSSHDGDLINDSSSHVDSTAPPTVIEQPAPVIVNQPTPVIVKDGSGE